MNFKVVFNLPVVAAKKKQVKGQWIQNAVTKENIHVCHRVL